MELIVDENIISAVNLWIAYGIKPGSCTALLLMGEYEEAFLHAHPLIKPHWNDHIKYIESLPEECRDENYKTWEGLKKLDWSEHGGDNNK